MPKIKGNQKNEIIGVIGILISIAVFFTLLIHSDSISGSASLSFPFSILSGVFFSGYALGGLKKGLITALGFLGILFLAIILGLTLRYIRSCNIHIF